MTYSTPSFFIFLLSLMFLSACGGSGGGNNAQMPPVNVITDTDGDGVLDDVDIDDDNDGLIEISTLEQLDWMRNDLAGEKLVDNDGNATFEGCPANVCKGYELVTDLDFDTNGDGVLDGSDTYYDYDGDGQNNGWLPVGWLPSGALADFVADFDGNDHRISNLYINRVSGDITQGWGVGLFALVNGATRPITLRNLVLDGAHASINGVSYVGALAGYTRNGVTVSNITSDIDIAGTASLIGGLIGNITETEIADCASSGVVTGDINSSVTVGGLVGKAANSNQIIRSAATGNVTGNETVGGLLGMAFGSGASITTISDSTASGDVTADRRDAGGLLGYGFAGVTIQSSSASGSVNGVDYTGGLVGRVEDNATITDSFATGNVSGQNHTGGLAGWATGAIITDSYAAGDVSGLILTGGLAGLAEPVFSITGCYASGAVTGLTYTGGLIGRAMGGGDVQQSYFTGSVTSTGYYTGGIIGSANFRAATPSLPQIIGTGDVVLDQIFTTGDVVGTSYVGGLIGLSYNMTMDNSFATGTVAGNSLYIGGLLGDANDGSIITRGLAANVVTLISSTSLGALVGYSSGVSYTNNYHANDQGIVSAIGQNLDTGGSNPPGTTGSNLAELQFVTSAGQSGLFTNWGTVWDFGSTMQLPGLVINGAVLRDGDADGLLD